MVKNLSAMQKIRVRYLDHGDPPEKGMATHSSILAWGNPKDRGAWRATASGVTNMSDMAEQPTPSKPGPSLAAEALRQPTF